MKQQQPRQWLLKLTFKALKYFFISLVGCAIAFIMAFILEWTLMTEVIMFASEHLLPRALVFLGCLVAIAVITESLRY